MKKQPTENQTVIGIDIGGTKISSARVQAGEKPADFQQSPTPHNAKDFIETLVTMVESLKQKDPANPVVAVGIATAGIVDTIKGMILGSTGNLPFLREIPGIKEALEKRINLPVYVENDANAAAYGEFKTGAAKGKKNVLMITLGTGVGGGIIVNEKLLHGGDFSAAEVGHLAVGRDKERLCTCGKWDCWEAYASGTGLKETAHRILKTAPNAELSKMMQGKKSIDDVGTHDVIAALEGGEPLAQEIMNTWHEHVAVGLGSLINILNPDIIVVGGGMAQFVDFKLLTELTAKRAMNPASARLVKAELGNQAGIVGAGYLALDELDAN